MDFAQVFLYRGLDRERDIPKAERAVADSNFHGAVQSALLDVDQELTPALCALAHADLEADQFFFAFWRRGDQRSLHSPWLSTQACRKLLLPLGELTVARTKFAIAVEFPGPIDPCTALGSQIDLARR